MHIQPENSYSLTSKLTGTAVSNMVLLLHDQVCIWESQSELKTVIQDVEENSSTDLNYFP